MRALKQRVGGYHDGIATGKFNNSPRQNNILTQYIKEKILLQQDRVAYTQIV